MTAVRDRRATSPVIVVNEPGAWADGIPRGEWRFLPDSASGGYRATGPGVVLIVDEAPRAWAWAVHLSPAGGCWARGLRSTRQAALNAAAYSADRRAHHLRIGEADPTRSVPSGRSPT